jgi:hypothetical protein
LIVSELVEVEILKMLPAVPVETEVITFPDKLMTVEVPIKTFCPPVIESPLPTVKSPSVVVPMPPFKVCSTPVTSALFKLTAEEETRPLLAIWAMPVESPVMESWVADVVANAELPVTNSGPEIVSAVAEALPKVAWPVTARELWKLAAPLAIKLVTVVVAKVDVPVTDKLPFRVKPAKVGVEVVVKF